MTRYLTAILLVLFFASPAIAEKPGWTGKDKPTAGQKEAHRAAMKSKRGFEQNLSNNKHKLKKQKAQKNQRKLDVL